jgi:endoglucanase
MFNRNVVACVILGVFLVVIGGCVEQKTDVSYTPPNHTDQNWVKGILIHTPGFLIAAPIKEQTKNNFAVGRKVTFSDGTVRTIAKVEENSGNLIVFVDGAPLDGNVVGYPKMIVVTDAAK